MAHSKAGFTFTWRIKNFSMLPHQKGEMLESPSFRVDILMNTKWNLKLYPAGDPTKDANFICCYLRRADFDLNPTSTSIGFSLTIGSTEDAVISKTTGNTFYNISDKGLGYSLLNITDENKHRYLSQDVLTITCFIWPSEEKGILPTVVNNPTKNCSVVTQIKVQLRTCIWPITNINQLKEKPKRSYMNLYSALDEASSTRLSFYLSENSDDEYANIQICQINCPDIHQNFVKCKITILCDQKEYQDSCEASHLYGLTSGEIWNFPEFIKKSNLVDEKYIYNDNTLFLQCEFSSSRKGSEYHLEGPRYIPCDFQAKTLPELNCLSGSIREFYVSQKFCDVSICAGGRTFPFYKLILCSRSPVFSAMFENDMKETNTGVVEITDLDSETTERMLTFMHSDVVEEKLSTDDICKLYSAADKYQITPLKRQCSLLLLSNLSVQNVNVWDTLVIADRHQDSFLLTLVHNFLRSHSDEIFYSLEWRNFMKRNPQLSSETMLNIFLK